MTDQLIDRPTAWGTAGDHERRIRALEALQPCCGDSGGGQTYADEVLAHPCVANFWPMNDTSGGAVELVAGDDLIENPAGFALGQPVSAQGTYSFTYSQPGPFVDAPSVTSIKFNGDASGASSYGTILYRDYGAGNIPMNSPYTMMGFTLFEDGTLRCPWSAIGGGANDENVFSQSSSNLSYGFINGGGFAVATGATTVVTNQWYLTAERWNGTDVDLFLDGAIEATGVSSVGSPFDERYLRFGAAGFGASGPTNFMKGRLSQWAFFTCALTDDEIANFATLGGGGNAAAGMVLTSDGEGGTYWAYPTITVEY